MTILINSLDTTHELDRKAMSEVRGGSLGLLSNRQNSSQSGKLLVYSATLKMCYEAEPTCGDGGVDPADLP
jgi:hypothetical protein